jgi:6-pyruvoyltetrahydropterin/6-carboxytetrahydropterin synthase
MTNDQSSFPKAYFGRRYPLSASHRLHSEQLTAFENQQAYGKCNNPHGHGHNYVVEVLVSGVPDSDTGMVINMADLDKVVDEKLLRRFDHTNLNVDPLFMNRVPTTENLCMVAIDLLQQALPSGCLSSVRVEETENNFFQCFAS